MTSFTNMTLEQELEEFRHYTSFESNLRNATEGFMDTITTIIRGIIEVIMVVLRKLKSIAVKIYDKIKKMLNIGKDYTLPEIIVDKETAQKLYENSDTSTKREIDISANYINTQISKMEIEIMKENEAFHIENFLREYVDKVEVLLNTYLDINFSLYTNATQVDMTQTYDALVAELLQRNINVPKWFSQQITTPNIKKIIPPKRPLLSTNGGNDGVLTDLVDYTEDDFTGEKILHTYKQTATVLADKLIANVEGKYNYLLEKMTKLVRKSASVSKNINYQEATDTLTRALQNIGLFIALFNVDEYNRFALCTSILKLFEMKLGPTIDKVVRVTRNLEKHNTDISGICVKNILEKIKPVTHVNEVPVFLIEDILDAGGESERGVDSLLGGARPGTLTGCIVKFLPTTYTAIFATRESINHKYSRALFGHEYGHHALHHLVTRINMSLNMSVFFKQISPALAQVMSRPLVHELQADAYSANNFSSPEEMLGFLNYLADSLLRFKNTKLNRKIYINGLPLSILDDLSVRIDYFKKWVKTGTQPPIKKGAYEYLEMVEEF